ncbi:hypothetical protein Pla8534_18290 [Lignipirellula cremea]|uniref:Leucine Rich repeats (2 copies) n=1 Tax=Lignipirellula cremea TaxID=2528010 RepID=A0A518DQC3_9BACT|nr:hypothetical protein Pla8534_18290 [Lignipirellula cremea]
MQGTNDKQSPDLNGTASSAIRIFLWRLPALSVVFALSFVVYRGCIVPQLSVEAIERLGGSVGYESAFGITACEYVSLSDTAATDADLVHVCNVEPHSYVYLDGTSVTDEGLKLFAGWRLLELDLRNTRVTEKGVAKLKRTMPRCKIRVQVVASAGLAE